MDVAHGLHSRNSPTQDPHYVVIGNIDLIDRRRHRAVPVAPGGMLSDYLPFYFTPFSPMLYNIHTGRGAVPRRTNEESCLLGIICSTQAVKAELDALIQAQGLQLDVRVMPQWYF